MDENIGKVEWSGRIIAVQPRIRLLRSFDQRSHNYLGYVLSIEGKYGDNIGVFRIAVGNSAHEKHQFQVGMELSGESVPVNDPRLETAEFYKTSGIKVIKSPPNNPANEPPYKGIPPDLETYRSRGHRRLDVRTYEDKCLSCIWGCQMPVEMIIDQWNPSKKKYRYETFCYGPKNCPLYNAGPKRRVPGRKGMSYTEEDWVDDDATSHRGHDE